MLAQWLEILIKKDLFSIAEGAAIMQRLAKKRLLMWLHTLIHQPATINYKQRAYVTAMQHPSTPAL